MGLMQDQAMKVVEAMSAIAAKSPKERLKQAARLQAVGGAMGFGGEAAQAAGIMRRGFNKEGDREQFAELQQTMQQSMGKFMGQSLQHEMMGAQLLQSTQMEDLLGPKSAFADLNTEQFKATKRAEKLHRERNRVAGATLGIIQGIYALMGGPLLKILGGILGGIGVLGAGKFLSSAITGALSGTGLMGTLLKSLLGFGIVGIVVAAVAGAFAWDEANTNPGDRSAWDKVMRFIGAEDENDAAGFAAAKERADVVAEHAKVQSEAILKQWGGRVEKMTAEGRKRTGGTFSLHGAGAEEIAIGNDKTMHAGGYAKLDKFDKTKHDVAARLTAMQKEVSARETASMKMRNDGQIADAKAAEDVTTEMKAAVKQLEQLNRNIKDPDSAVLNEIKTGNEEAKTAAEKALDAAKKSNTSIIWARTAPAA